MQPGGMLLTEAAIAVAALIVLIVRVRLSPFIALTLVSLALALVVGLGTILGKMMVESRGAERIADSVIGFFGPARADWAMMTVALVVGLPVFFEVGFVLLVPIVFTLARRLGQHPMRMGLPMAAGLSVVHAMVPPHPAALLATRRIMRMSGLPCCSR